MNSPNVPPSRRVGYEPSESPLDRLHKHLERQRANRRPRGRRRAGPMALGDSLSGALKELQLVSRLRARKLHAAWAAALAHDPAELRRTRIRKLAHGVLTVEVDSAARVVEFQRFHKPHLLAALNRELGGRPHLIDVRFVLGAFNDDLDTPGRPAAPGDNRDPNDVP